MMHPKRFCSGIYSANALLLSWPGENVSNQTKRAVAVALQISIGDIGAISGVSSRLLSWVAPSNTMLVGARLSTSIQRASF